MTCPKCNSDTRVIDSRLLAGTRAPRPGRLAIQHLRRRRECMVVGCSFRFTTLECIEAESLEERLDNIEQSIRTLTQLAKAIFSSEEITQIEIMRHILKVPRQTLCLESGLNVHYMDSLINGRVSEPNPESVGKLYSTLADICRKGF